MSRSALRRPEHPDRFAVCLVMAFALHAALVLGVRFGIDLDPAPQMAESLDVVLVRWRSEDAPEQADFLAQANQRGSGENAAPRRPARPLSGELPEPAQGIDPARSVASLPQPQSAAREIVAATTPTASPQAPTRVGLPQPAEPTAALLMRQSMDMASLQPAFSQRREEGAQVTRREYISANTREYEFASYMSAWVAKVERVGNLNYPLELREKKLHGDLVLSVGILPDGRVESIQVMRSSGIAEIDRAAEQIVQLAAPYAPLSERITDRFDVLHITRTWRFGSSFSAD